MTNNKMSGGKKLAVGASIAAIGAGAYYFLGPNAKTHQKKAKALVAKMKKEVASEVKKVKEVSAPIYNKAVEVVSDNYAKQYKEHAKEIKALAEQLKAEWKDVKKVAKKTIKAAKKKAE